MADRAAPPETTLSAELRRFAERLDANSKLTPSNDVDVELARRVLSSIHDGAMCYGDLPKPEQAREALAALDRLVVRADTLQTERDEQRGVAAFWHEKLGEILPKAERAVAAEGEAARLKERAERAEAGLTDALRIRTRFRVTGRWPSGRASWRSFTTSTRTSARGCS